MPVFCHRIAGAVNRRIARGQIPPSLASALADPADPADPTDPTDPTDPG